MRKLLVAAFAGALACGSQEAPPQASFAGTWRATSALFTGVENPSLQVEAIAAGHAISLTLRTGGTFALSMTEPGEAPFVATGTWSASIDTLTLSYQTGMSGESQFDFALSGASLTLTGGHVPFDVNADGADEEATLALGLSRVTG